MSLHNTEFTELVNGSHTLALPDPVPLSPACSWYCIMAQEQCTSPQQLAVSKWTAFLQLINLPKKAKSHIWLKELSTSRLVPQFSSADKCKDKNFSTVQFPVSDDLLLLLGELGKEKQSSEKDTTWGALLGCNNMKKLPLAYKKRVIITQDQFPIFPKSLCRGWALHKMLVT